MTETATLPVLEIRPTKGFLSLNLRDVWNYRELLYFLVWRDIKVRYKQTVLGAAWAILQPLLTMVAFSIFFGHLAKMPSDGIPYPLFAYAALLPWTLFAYSMTEAGNSLVGSQNLITKVYFPRLVIPLAAVLGGLVDFGVSFVVLILLMIGYGIVPTLAILTIPFFILLVIATALAVGVWLAALNVQFRDVRYTIPFLTQFWLFLTPVAYSSTMVSPRWRVVYGLNPMAGVVEGFRWALLGRKEAPGPMLAVSIAIVALLLVTGLYHFRRMESSFADNI